MIGIAVGQMGLSLETFLSLTPQQFNLAYDRFMERIEADDIMAERRLRKAVFSSLCPPKKKKITLSDLWEIKGDKQKEAEKTVTQVPSTRRRFEELQKKWQ